MTLSYHAINTFANRISLRICCFVFIMFHECKTPSQWVPLCSKSMTLVHPLFRPTTNKWSELYITRLSWGNPLVASCFPHKVPVMWKAFQCYQVISDYIHMMLLNVYDLIDVVIGRPNRNIVNYVTGKKVFTPQHLFLKFLHIIHAVSLR